MRLVPTASEQWGRTLFAHLMHRQLKQRPRNVGRLAPLFLVPFSLSTAVEAAREAFPSLGWAQDMVKRHNRRCGAAPWVWSLQQKFKGYQPLFIGLLAPDRSRGGDLTILSLTKLDLVIVREKSKRGGILFDYEFFTNSVSGVALGLMALGR
jgi:hypothetical protein